MSSLSLVAMGSCSSPCGLGSATAVPCARRPRCGHRSETEVVGASADDAGQMGGVLADEAQERRAAGVLPRQPEEVQPGDVGHAAAVHDMAVAQDAGYVDP